MTLVEFRGTGYLRTHDSLMPLNFLDQAPLLTIPSLCKVMGKNSNLIFRSYDQDLKSCRKG